MRLYVGTYKKYNEGNLFGKWLNLDDYANADEFRSACLELHNDERDPELMFQDFEEEYGWDGRSLYCESAIPDEYWDIREKIDNSYIDDDIFAAYIDAVGGEVSVDSLDKCEDAYCGQYDDPTDFAEEMMSECYDMREIPEIIRYHIDWKGIWRDLSFDGYCYENGYIFDTNR